MKTFTFTFYIYAFSRRFYPKRLTVHSSYSFYIISKPQIQKISLFCVYLKLSLCAFTLILPARVTNVHAAMTVCSCCIPVAPSPPICNIVGKTEYFENIELTCRSEEGTPTPAYKWQSYNVNNNARQLPLKATDGTCVCDAAQIHAERYGVKSMPHILANESIENKINVLFANKNKELKMKYYEKMHFANKNKEYNFSL